jgi:hypothetical protein
MSLDLLEILSNCESTSSGYGPSYYMTSCARRANIEKEFPESRTTSFGAQRGTAFHKLMELYYAGQLQGVALPVSDMPDKGDFVQEALRLFVGYSALFPHDEWQVVASEVRLGKTIEELQTLAQIVDPFIPSLDLIINLNEEQVALFEQRRKVPIVPGNYLLDFKTHSQRESNAYIKYSRHPQLISYDWSWNLIHPETPLKGFILVNVIGHKPLRPNESFQTFVYPKPGEDAYTATGNFFKNQKENFKKNQPNLSACDDWGGCPHYVTGRCNRI